MKYQDTMSFDGDEKFIMARWLSPDCLSPDCRVLADRDKLLACLAKGGTALEVGTQYGHFAKNIFDIIRPERLDIVDQTFQLLDYDYFNPHISSGRVRLHEGDSSSVMATLPAASYDLIYVDGNHFYEGVFRDAQEAIRLAKPTGVIVFNDYTAYSPLERTQYGVVRVVNDLCLDHGFEMFLLGLHILGYHDVAIRRRRRPGS